MFSKLFNRKLLIFAPMDGQVIRLEEVPDPVFNQKMIGEGIAIIPTSEEIFAPIDGTVMLVSDTKHAIGIRSKDGTELLIHVGLETLSLKGVGFSVLVEEGQKLTAGQLMMRVDWNYLHEQGKDIITPVVITNSDERNIQVEDATKCIQGETLLMTVSTR